MSSRVQSTTEDRSVVSKSMPKIQKTNGKRCITYGTFDLLHEGHRVLLRKARELGSYLIVAVVSDNFNIARGKLNVHQSTVDRVDAVRETGLADEIVLEECDMKVQDVQKYRIDVCVVGFDWAGSPEYEANL